MSYRSIPNRLEAAHLALTNALAEEELRAALAAYGYDEARLRQGQDAYQNALDQFHQQKEKQNRHRAASLALRRADESISQRYIHTVKLCRVLYRDEPATYRALGLAGARATAFAARIVQMRLFYTTLLGRPEILSDLAAYGVQESQLQAAAAQVADLEVARAQRERENGAAQDATQNHHQALSALDRWMADFRAIARLALAETPQRLEMLGLSPA